MASDSSLSLRVLSAERLKASQLLTDHPDLSETVVGGRRQSYAEIRKAAKSGGEPIEWVLACQAQGFNSVLAYNMRIMERRRLEGFLVLALTGVGAILLGALGLSVRVQDLDGASLIGIGLIAAALMSGLTYFGWHWLYVRKHGYARGLPARVRALSLALVAVSRQRVYVRTPDGRMRTFVHDVVKEMHLSSMYRTLRKGEAVSLKMIDRGGEVLAVVEGLDREVVETFLAFWIEMRPDIRIQRF